jgi:hypothetical protein
LLDIIPQLNIQRELLSAESRKMYEAIRLKSEV